MAKVGVASWRAVANNTSYGLLWLYGLWSTFPCERTRWTQKCMEFKGVWGMCAMGYEGVNCNSLDNIFGIVVTNNFS